MENYKRLYKNKKFKISASWNEESELPDGSYSISDIQDYFKYIFKKAWKKTGNPSIRIYINKIENRITFKIITGDYLELLTLETIKLLGSTKSKTTKNGNGENVPFLEITEVVLVHCNIVSNNYQRSSKVLYAFVPNKSLDQLLDISPKNFIFLKIFDLELPYIALWFIDQSSYPLETEDKINITLAIN